MLDKADSVAYTSLEPNDIRQSLKNHLLVRFVGKVFNRKCCKEKNISVLERVGAGA